MLTQYIQAAMERAHYEIIRDEEPYYGQIPGIEGLWASGKSLEECRKNLVESLEDWLLFSIAKGLPMPAFGTISLRLPADIAS